jgi:hypothetical protein
MDKNLFAEQQQKFDRAIKNYETAKNSYYGTGGTNAGMIKTIVKELGEDKQVAYNSAEQVKVKIGTMVESTNAAIMAGETLLQRYEQILSNPTIMAGVSSSGQQAAAQIEQLKVNLNQLRIKIDNIRKEQLEVEREGATIQQSMRQRDIRFFGGSEVATEAELIQNTIGAPFAVGHVAELNKLNDSLVQEQVIKIQNLENMAASASGERLNALQADIIQEKNKLKQLEAKGLQNLQDVIGGQFKKDFYTKAIESPGAAFANKSSKFIKIAKFVKVSPEVKEVGEYWDGLLPGLGTALVESPEHSGETIEQINEEHSKD